MGRPERELSGEATPLTELAGRLRALRRAAGQPSYRRLAMVTHYSAATLARAAGGHALPSLEVTLAYATACGGDPAEWQTAWAAAEAWMKSRPADAAPGDADAGPEAAPVDHPAQLPADTADFSGREEPVRTLCDLLGAEPAAGRPGAVLISAITGMGGIGKTALAVHAAHRLSDRFPDGQLFIGLQGTTGPMRASEVLARFLRDLGVPDAAIPAGEADRAARYRTALAGRRVLIVLDDARDAAQVRPLLPGTAGCAVIVTSRGTLSGLSGATPLELGVLDEAESRELFTAIVGPARAAAEPSAVAAVLASCAGLPLAIQIAAGRLAARPTWRIAHLATRLADERSRLAELSVGDLAVPASFAVSYDDLPAADGPGGRDPARVFRLLGLPAGTALSLPAVVALAGQPVEEVSAALETLTEAHLLECPAPDRYRLHDLLRSYAADLARRAIDETERKAAVVRMLQWYGAQAAAAARVLAPSDRFVVSGPFAAASLLALAGPAQALDWFETELANLMGAVRQAADLGLDDTAARTAAAMWTFFQRSPYTEEWLATSQLGVRSARRAGDEAVLGSLLNGLGQAYSALGRFAEAGGCLSEALKIRRRTGDRTGQATILNSLAIDLYYQGRFEEALDRMRLALAIHVELGERHYTAVILNNIGDILLCLKRPDEALSHLGQAVAILRETGERHLQGVTEATLGDTCLNVGRLEDAVVHYREARAALADTAREHADQADVLYGLGQALARLQRSDEAREAWLEALPILDRASDPRAAELRDLLARGQ
ncbi:MAG TPA: tetratricopeptide repeat protein [Trebonia sp.]|nr:tetratricopeptide repeat protein [Trebonia sp.]